MIGIASFCQHSTIATSSSVLSSFIARTSRRLSYLYSASSASRPRRRANRSTVARLAAPNSAVSAGSNRSARASIAGGRRSAVRTCGSRGGAAPRRRLDFIYRVYNSQYMESIALMDVMNKPNGEAD